MADETNEPTQGEVAPQPEAPIETPAAPQPPVAEEPAKEVEKTEEAPSKPEDETGEKDKKKKKVKEPERQDVTTLHERTIATMSYFSFLAIVPFYLKKDSEFCRFHGKQGLLIAIIFFLARLFTVVDLIMDIMLILQIVILFVMGFAALSGRWRKIPFGYNWACQLEDALTLKSKEEQSDEETLKPNESPEAHEEKPAPETHEETK